MTDAIIVRGANKRYGDFAALAIGFENLEGVAEFFEGACHELHFAAAGLIAGELEDRMEHVGGKLTIDDSLAEDKTDLTVDSSTSGTAVRTAACAFRFIPTANPARRFDSLRHASFVRWAHAPFK